MPSTWTGYGTGTPARCSWPSAANSALAHCPRDHLPPGRAAGGHRPVGPGLADPAALAVRAVAVEHPVLGIPVPLGRQQAGPAGSRHAAADQEDVGLLAGLQHAQLGVDRGQLGDQPARVGLGAAVPGGGWSQVDQRSPAGSPSTASWASGGGQRPAVPVALGKGGLFVVKPPLAAAVGRIGHRRCSSGRAVKEGSVVTRDGHHRRPPSARPASPATTSCACDSVTPGSRPATGFPRASGPDRGRGQRQGRRVLEDRAGPVAAEVPGGDPAPVRAQPRGGQRRPHGDGRGRRSPASSPAGSGSAGPGSPGRGGHARRATIWPVSAAIRTRPASPRGESRSGVAGSLSPPAPPARPPRPALSPSSGQRAVGLAGRGGRGGQRQRGQSRDRP